MTTDKPSPGRYKYIHTLLKGETLPLAGWPAYASDGPGCVVPDYAPNKYLGVYMNALTPGHFGWIKLDEA